MDRTDSGGVIEHKWPEVGAFSEACTGLHIWAPEFRSRLLPKPEAANQGRTNQSVPNGVVNLRNTTS